MDKKLLAGFILGATTVLWVSGATSLYRNIKAARPNPWEEAFESAELVVYQPEWGAGDETNPATAFENIFKVVDLAPMRVFKTFTPKGTRALLVCTMYSGPIAIYETAYLSREYAAVGNAEVMNKRINNVSVFNSKIPKEYLVNLVDPTSSVYNRDELDPYYDFNPREIVAAANNDKALIDFVNVIIDQATSPDFNVRNFVEDIIPTALEERFAHISLNVDITSSEEDIIDFRIGERQEIRRVDNTLRNHLEDDLKTFVSEIDEKPLSEVVIEVAG